MSTSEIEKAFSVFRGIDARDAYLATTKYINPKKYIEHNPHVAGGVVGLKEYISHISKENRRRKVVRAFQDGPTFSPMGRSWYSVRVSSSISSDLRTV